MSSWPGAVCTGSYSETQHFKSMRVAGCCSFSLLKISGVLTAISTESDVGGSCANHKPPAWSTYRGLCVPSPSLVLLGATNLSGQLVNVFGIFFHAWYALANSRFTWHTGCVLSLHYNHGWDHVGFAELLMGPPQKWCWLYVVLLLLEGVCWSWTCRSFLLCASQEAACFIGRAGTSSDLSLQHFIHLVYT